MNQLAKNIMALQINFETKPSIHAGQRPVRAGNGAKVDKLGLSHSAQRVHESHLLRLVAFDSHQRRVGDHDCQALSTRHRQVDSVLAMQKLDVPWQILLAGGRRRHDHQFGFLPLKLVDDADTRFIQQDLLQQVDLHVVRRDDKYVCRPHGVIVTLLVRVTLLQRDGIGAGVRLPRSSWPLNVEAGLVHRQRTGQASRQDVLTRRNDGLACRPADEVRRFSMKQAGERHVASVAGDLAVGKPVQRVDQDVRLNRARWTNAQMRWQRIPLGSDLQADTPCRAIEIELAQLLGRVGARALSAGPELVGSSTGLGLVGVSTGIGLLLPRRAGREDF